MTNPVICPVCQSTDTATWSVAKDYEYQSTDKSYTYYRCAACETIYINPIPPDELKTIYPSNYYSFVEGKKNWAFQVKEWLDKRLFKKILGEIQSDQVNVLDVGGGTGWLPDLLKKTDSRINITQIVDIDPQAKQRAEIKGHLYFEGRIEEFKSNTRFHLILMLNLIEHVSDPAAVLQNAEQLLAPGGIILLKTPNTRSWDTRLFKNSYWGGLHCPRHWIIFSVKSFGLLVAKTNLTVSSLQYTQGGVFWAFSIIVYLSRKKILKVTRERPVIYHPLFPLISSLFAAFDFMRRPFAKTSQLFITLRHPSSE